MQFSLKFYLLLFLAIVLLLEVALLKDTNEEVKGMVKSYNEFLVG